MDNSNIQDHWIKPGFLSVLDCIPPRGDLYIQFGDIVRLTGLSKATVNYHLDQLVKQNLIKSVKRGKYRYVQKTGEAVKVP